MLTGNVILSSFHSLVLFVYKQSFFCWFIFFQHEITKPEIDTLGKNSHCNRAERFENSGAQCFMHLVQRIGASVHHKKTCILSGFFRNRAPYCIPSVSLFYLEDMIIYYPLGNYHQLCSKIIITF